MRLRTRIATAVGALSLALTATVVATSPAQAATYGYIAYHNNCSHSRYAAARYEGGLNHGNLAFYDTSVPAGAVRHYKVPSAQKYWVYGNGDPRVVTVLKLADRIHTVAFKAC